MKKEEVFLKVDGLAIYGELYLPDKANPSYSALCLCHGIPAVPYNPTDRGYDVLAERFCASGFVTFFLHFRGTRRSEGNFDLAGWTRDLEAAVDFLHMRDEVRESGLTLVGSSGGAAAAVYVAAHNKRVSAVAALACPATLAVIKDNPQPVLNHFRKIGIIRDEAFPLSLDEWLGGLEVVSAINWIDKITPRPLLLVHGDNDETVPVEHSRRLFEKALEPKDLVIIPGAGHRLRIDEHAIMAVLDWLKEIRHK
jgi:dipeptidyl aminopeptidase/acylaminoacyl peptidase